MKLLYVITGLGGGGAEKVVVDLAERMHALGHQVKIAYLKGEIVVRPQNSAIELVYLGLEHLSSGHHAYKNYKALIGNFKPDVVHAHMVHANIFTRLARIFTAVPKLICTAHSNNEGGKLRMLAYRLTDSHSELLTNVSQAAVDNFIALGAATKNRIQLVYNGIDLNKFQHDTSAQQQIRAELHLGADPLLFVAVGRLHEAKDYPNLLAAFALFLANHPADQQAHLAIAGEGEQRQHLEKQIEQLQLQAHVTLLGRRNDIVKLMSAADVFVLSSSFEGFGLVVAEAMACQTYVVATDCGGVREVMGGYGCLCPRQNSIALAEAMQYAIQLSSEQRMLNNQQADQYVQQHFNLDQIIQQWLVIYES